MKKKKKLKRIKKPKLPSISKLNKKLWKACSLFIRTRDHFTCYVCGRKGSGSQIHAGHLFPQEISNVELKFDARGIRASCYHCNINCGGNGALMYRKMLEEFGQSYMDDLYNQLGKNVEWKRLDYETKIEYYEKALSMLKTS